MLAAFNSAVNAHRSINLANTLTLTCVSQMFTRTISTCQMFCRWTSTPRILKHIAWSTEIFCSMRGKALSSLGGPRYGGMKFPTAVFRIHLFVLDPIPTLLFPNSHCRYSFVTCVLASSPKSAVRHPMLHTLVQVVLLRCRFPPPRFHCNANSP